MKLLLALPLVALAAGCLLGPMDIQMSNWDMGGSISIPAWSVEPLAAPLGELAARVTIRTWAHEAENATLFVALDDEACSRYGPPSAPETAVARERRALASGSYRGVETFELGGASRPGTHASVFVEIGADGAMGPVFGRCRDFARPIPRGP